MMADARVVPGTIHLVDLEGILSVKHASGAQKDVVLIPPPSDDANDPLNWSPARKLTLSASISVSAFPSLSSFENLSMAKHSN